MVLPVSSRRPKRWRVPGRQIRSSFTREERHHAYKSLYSKYRQFADAIEKLSVPE